MKRLLLLLPLLGLASCSYPSKQEAKTACDQWVEKGGMYVWKSPEMWRKNEWDLINGLIDHDTYKKIATVKTSFSNIRSCEHEKETKQFLGYTSSRKEGEIYWWGKEGRNRRIVRYFRY